MQPLLSTSPSVASQRSASKVSGACQGLNLPWGPVERGLGLVVCSHERLDPRDQFFDARETAKSDCHLDDDSVAEGRPSGSSAPPG